MGPLGAVVDSILQNLKEGIKKDRTDLRSLWPQIAGSAYAPHTQPVLQKDGTLCVWVDDSVLAFDMSRKHQGTLLKRTQEALGEEAVKKIIFRVGQNREN